MITWLRTVRQKRQQRLLQKKIAFAEDADAQAAADGMKRKTPTHSQMRSPGA